MGVPELLDMHRNLPACNTLLNNKEEKDKDKKAKNGTDQ